MQIDFTLTILNSNVTELGCGVETALPASASLDSVLDTSPRANTCDAHVTYDASDAHATSDVSDALTHDISVSKSVDSEDSAIVATGHQDSSCHDFLTEDQTATGQCIYYPGRDCGESCPCVPLPPWP